MRVLLDTHTLIWAKIAPATLSRQATVIIADPDNEILVSAASGWEIATKYGWASYPKHGHSNRNSSNPWKSLSGFTLIPIDAATALRAGRLMAKHGDLFDRVIAAQALTDDIPVLSADAKLDTFGVRRIW